MALYGQMRDISMFRFVNRELMQRIISQQVVFYKYNVVTTKVNMYGESVEGRNFADPVLLFALIETSNFENPVDDFGVDFKWEVTYKFLRDDLVDAQVLPESGDIIMWDESYWEINNVNNNQLIVGKDPSYPYNENPLNPGLENFGSDWSIICTAHYTPSDKVQITRERI